MRKYGYLEKYNYKRPYDIESFVIGIACLKIENAQCKNYKHYLIIMNDAPAPVAAPVAVPVPLPNYFVVQMPYGNRDGYGLFRWSEGGLNADGTQIHVLNRYAHGDLYYNVLVDTTVPTTAYQTVQARKANGTVVRSMTWRYTRECLINAANPIIRRYPVIQITSISTRLVPCRAGTFIPIVTAPNPVNPVAVDQPAVNPPVQQVPKIYTIATIPQHAVRAVLRDAAMQEEVCSITGEEIDITNGAMTSCFHLFEKNAIATWLAMPNSRDKCPVCNSKCNSFTIE